MFASRTMNGMDRSGLQDQWVQEEHQPFSGWDFAHLEGRMISGEPPWSYPDRARVLMRSAASMVDIDTGGGERLLELRDSWPKKVTATEGYPPNVRLATERLAPLGVSVVEAESTGQPLPFADGAFDLVLNRHAGINVPETARILKSGGTFLTRQVHGMWAHDLMAFFNAKPQWPWATAAKYAPELESAGLKIVAVKEWEGSIAFTDVGAIVYYLRAVPWLVPDFSVRKYLNQLHGLQDRLDAGTPLSFFAANYLIEARKL